MIQQRRIRKQIRKQEKSKRARHPLRRNLIKSMLSRAKLLNFQKFSSKQINTKTFLHKLHQRAIKRKFHERSNKEKLKSRTLNSQPYFKEFQAIKNRILEEASPHINYLIKLQQIKALRESHLKLELKISNMEFRSLNTYRS